ncbi:MAG: ImmA/IrrE family metallo-endopeptidase [Pseudomonadota bacterium]
MSIRVNPEILVWARETAGLSVEDAAAKLQFTTSAKSTAAEKLTALEIGEKQPSRNQLSGMAKLYKRPLLVFYMAEPPRPGPRGTDFRQSPDARGARANAMLDALLRDVRARQETVRDMLSEEDDFEPLPYIGSVTVAEGVDDAVAAISEVLGIDPTAPRPGDADALFKRLRTAAEEAGVFVLVLGDLGSHHTTIPASVFRGFAIADPVAPFIVINAKDARPARAFTLIHELAHVFLGQTGVSGAISTNRPETDNARVERFCNDVAGEFLLPGAHFRQGVPAFDGRDVDTARVAVEAIAARWSVSEPMVAYRLNRTGDLSEGTYNTLREEYDARWQAKLARDRAAEGPPLNPRVMKQFYLGNALVGVVHRYVRDNALSHTKAAALLGSQPGAVEPLLRQFETKRGSFVSKAKA